MKQEFNWRDYDNYNEWLESVLETLTENIEEKDKEIERLHSIIKKAREYIEENKASLPMGRDEFTCEMRYSDEVVLANKLLEILGRAEEE